MTRFIKMVVDLILITVLTGIAIIFMKCAFEVLRYMVTTNTSIEIHYLSGMGLASVLVVMYVVLTIIFGGMCVVVIERFGEHLKK